MHQPLCFPQCWLIFVALNLVAESYVRYENCTEYVYTFKSRVSFHEATNIQLKGKVRWLLEVGVDDFFFFFLKFLCAKMLPHNLQVGFEFFSKKSQEAILHLYDARMALQSEEGEMQTIDSLITEIDSTARFIWYQTLDFILSSSQRECYRKWWFILSFGLIDYIRA